MRIPSRSRQYGLSFNITPLIDIIFLLIIFFLAASHLVRSETLEEVELPEATPDENPAETTPRRLMVTVTADRRFHLGSKNVDLAELEHAILAGGEKHPDTFEVRIRADRAVPYESIEPVLLACARAGISHVKFAIIPK